MGLDQWSVLQIHENELPSILKDYGISVYMLIINDYNVGPTLLFMDQWIREQDCIKLMPQESDDLVKIMKLIIKTVLLKWVNHSNSKIHLANIWKSITVSSNEYKYLNRPIAEVLKMSNLYTIEHE